MKILYVITSTEIGGAEKVLQELALETFRQNHQVRVLCINPLGAIATQLHQAGIEVITVFHKLPGKIIQKIRKEILSFQPDIVHAMLFRAIEYTRLACAKLDIKIVSTPHFDLSKKSFFFRLADKVLKDKDTLTIAESYSTARYLIEKQGYAKNKVYLLPNSVDPAKFFKDDTLRQHMRKQYGFHVKTVVFVCVARLAKVKAPFSLLQAFEQVYARNPEIRLVYVGDGEERAKLEKYIQEKHLSEVVFLEGERADINAFLNMADVFVLPSIEESLPLALLEALQVGLPCIVSKVGDMPILVEHGVNGFVCTPRDVTLLSCFISLLTAEEKTRQEMGKKSLEKASNQMGHMKQYQQIYEQLITNSFHVKTNQ